MGKLLNLLLAVSIFFHGFVYASPEEETYELTLAQNQTQSDFVNNLDELRGAILNNESHGLDVFRLLSQNFEDPKRNILAKNVEFRFFDKERAELGTSLFRSPDKSFYGKQLSSLEVYESGQVVHQIKINTSKVAWNNRFIFWVHEESQGAKELHFVDLDFIKIGKSELPIFRFPLKTIPEGNLKFNGQDLYIGDKKLRKKQIIDVSKLNQISFSLSVNLLDQDKMANTAAMMGEFHALYLEQSKREFNKKRRDEEKLLASQADIAQILKEIESSFDSEKFNLEKETKLLGSLEGSDREAKLAQIKKAISERYEDSDAFIKKLEESEQFKTTIQSSAIAQASHRSLMAKMHEFFLHMSVPRPDGAPKLKKAFLLIAAGIKEGKVENFKESFYHLYSNKWLKMNFGVAAAAGLGVMYPQEVSYFLLQSLEVSKIVFESVLGKVQDFGYLVKESAVATFSGFLPEVFSEVYIEDGRWHKTLTGLSALMGLMFVTLGMPHVIVNAIKLAKDLRAYDFSDLKKKYPKKRQFLKRLAKAFIHRQEVEQSDYIELMQDAEIKVSSAEKKEFTKEQDAEVFRILEEVKDKDFAPSKISNWTSSLFSRIEKNDTENNVDSTRMSFRKAITHFLFSFASFTNSGIVYATVWNYWFITRTLVFKPGLWPYLLMYPKFFKTAVLHKAKSINIPTKWNGGREVGVPFVSVFIERYKNKGNILRYEQLEKSIVDLEGQFTKAILPEAFKMSVRYTKNVKDFELITKENIKDYTNKKISSLSFKTKLFFQWYHHIASEKMFEQYLLKIGGEELLDLENTSEVKRKLVESGIEISLPLSESDLKDLYNEVDAKFNIYEMAKEQAEKSRFSVSNFTMNHFQKSLTGMDPRYSGQFSRFAISAEQMLKPKAVARAVRSSIVKMVVDKPMELAFLFVMVAGATGGLIEPIHDEMFSENSWFYLSKYQFLAGFAYGLISGLLANSWMKLQQDARVDSTGGFDNVPQGERSKKSFLFNFRQEMKAGDNTWWMNQKYYVEIIWANMGAAFVTMAATHWVSMGRFDLDVYIAGYLFAFLSPLSGLGFKLENAFEKASSWVVRDIPEEYRSHPAVIRYSTSAMAKLRVKFNIWYSIYENTLGHLTSNMLNMSTEHLGPRSFSRLVAGGYTFTEAVINFSDSMADKYPILEKPANLCRRVFFNNYTDGIKISKK